MSLPDSSPARLLVTDETRFTLVELCRICRVPEAEVRAWVVEGVLVPEGARPEEWRFAGSSIRRARTAHRLSRDLEVNIAGVALALELLDEIAALQRRLGALPAFLGPASVDPED